MATLDSECIVLHVISLTANCDADHGIPSDVGPH
jgi:hypothetical protein